MQIVNRMESNGENNMEEKVADKEMAIVCDVDLNENLSKQDGENTVIDVNKNIAKSEKLELHDNSQISPDTRETDLSPTTENCELHISEGSDTDGEGLDVHKDTGKFNGENDCKGCDQNNSEIEKEETDKDPTTVSTGTTDGADKNSHSADSLEAGDSNSEKMNEEIQDNANKSDDLEIYSENSKNESEKENEVELSKLSENVPEEKHEEDCDVDSTEITQSPETAGETSNSKYEEDKDVELSNLTSDKMECKESVSEETRKDDSSSEETLASAENSTKCSDGNSSYQNSDSVDTTDAKPSNEGNIVDGNCHEDIQGNDDNTNEEVNNDDKESRKSEIETNDSVKSLSVTECSASENEADDLKDTSKDPNTEHESEKENEVELSKLSENVSEEKHEEDCDVDISEITKLSETASETSNCANSNKDDTARTDCKDNLEHFTDDSASAQREQESITESKKEIETEVDTNLSENVSNVNSRYNIETVEGGQTPSNAATTSEVQQVDKQEQTDICNDKCQTVDTTSETISLEKSDLQSDNECDRIEHIAENTKLGAMQPLEETVKEDMGENVDMICDGIPKVEKQENDNDEAVQTEDKQMDTSSTQTVPKESKDQSSETNTQNVGSVETQTLDQTVKCEDKETGTDTVPKESKDQSSETNTQKVGSVETQTTDQIVKCEDKETGTDIEEATDTFEKATDTSENAKMVCDKETSVSVQESTDKSVQTESESNAGDLSNLEEEENKHSIQPKNIEQASQTDKRETSSLMTQTENLKSKKEQVLEEETGMLKDQLSEAKKMIQCLQAELAKTKAHSNYAVTTLQCQLKKSQEMQRAQRCQSDRQMGEVLAHMLFLEGQLKKDKTHIKHILRQKDDIIQKQQCDIEDLKNTNQRLIEAVREHYARKGKNGLSKDHCESIQGAEAEVPCSPKVKEKVKNRGAFGSMKDILWKHRSSLDLSEAGMEIQGNLKKDRQYSSQENLFSLGRKNKEARENRDKKCKSIAGYPDHSLDYLIPEESELRDISLHGSDSSLSKSQRSGRNVSWGSDSSDVNISHDNSGHLMVTSPSQMMSAGSMPTLTKNSNLDLVTKERPHSISSIESLSRENCSSIPGTPKMEEKVPHQVSQESSNPFKNLKTILKRKGSKMKNKKRTVSLSQSANPEYEEAMKKHFEKYEMS